MTSPNVTPTFSTPRNTIVLNGSNQSFASLRIEDPKKAHGSSPPLPTSDDSCLKTMLAKIPEVNQYFTVVEKLGEGTFSKVYKAKLKRPYRSGPPPPQSTATTGFVGSGGLQTPSNSSESVTSSSSSSGGHGHGNTASDGSSSSQSNGNQQEETYALKYLIPIVKPSRIAKELRFLRDLQGLSNVISIKACFFNAGHTVIVMPIIEHDKFLDYFQMMDIFELRDYLKNLLIALERVHSLGIIHRDIKPANFLYNRTTKKYALVDFGLSQTQRELDQAVSFLGHDLNRKSLNSVQQNQQQQSQQHDPNKIYQSKVRANLTYRFTKNCLILNPAACSPKPTTTVNSNTNTTNTSHVTATTTTTTTANQQVNLLSTNPSHLAMASMASTISLVKTKRSFDVMEDRDEKVHVVAIKDRQQTTEPNLRVPVHEDQSRNDHHQPNKRARFIETFNSSIFITPTTPKDPNTKDIFVPGTPPTKSRVPLSDFDANKVNQHQGYQHYHAAGAGPAPPVMNLQFTTPTKTEMVGEANRTPVKGNGGSQLFVPETPPKTVQKNFAFASAQKPQLQSLQQIYQLNAVQQQQQQNPHKENIIHHFQTPKTRTVPSMASFHKNRLQSKKILHPELSGIGSTISSLGMSGSGSRVSSESVKCDCVENSYICYACLSKPELNVPRAGTPGFRAPEILLRCGQQSPKIDVWSTGVIFASLLSGRYPFFRCMDDMTCLAEIVTILGSTPVKRAAYALNKTLVMSCKRKPMDLKMVCSKLREELEKSQVGHFPKLVAPDSAYDLLTKLLDPNPNSRLSAAEALKHPFFTDSMLDLIAS